MTLTHEPTTSTGTGIDLPGLAGNRTAGWLAALGLLGLLRQVGHAVRLYWSDSRNPTAHLSDLPVPADELPEYLHALLSAREAAPAPWEPHLQPTKLPQDRWRALASTTPVAASVEPLSPAAWLATATETGGKPGFCAHTRLLTLSGQQRPGKIIATLHNYVTSRPPQLIHEALLAPRYHRANNLSLGIDPAGITDAATHGKDAPPAVIPALELLAVYGLTWFPVFDGQTTAVIRTPRSRSFHLTWPLWRQPLGPAAIHTLLTHPAVPDAASGDSRASARLASMGVHSLATAERAARGHQTSSYAVFRHATLTRI